MRKQKSETTRMAMEVFASKIKDHMITTPKSYDLYDQSTWNEIMKSIYKSIYSSIYVRNKKADTLKSNTLWVHTLNNGVIAEYLSELGIVVTKSGYCRFWDSGRKLLEIFFKEILSKELEKRFGITGVRLIKDASPNAMNVLSFLNAECKQDYSENE